MSLYTVSEARGDLYNLIDKVSESHEPAYITGKRHNAVLLSEEDYRSMQETLYIVSIPGLREDILAGKNEPNDQCPDKLDW